MELAAGIGEQLFVLNLFWIVISLPLWAGLGVATYLGDRRSRHEASGVGCDPGDRSGGTTRLGRTAMVLALGTVALIVVFFAVFSVLSTQGDQSAILLPLLLAVLALLLLADAMSIGLAVVLVAVMRDVAAERRVAGRETLIAYLTITAASAVLLGAALLSHAFRWIV